MLKAPLFREERMPREPSNVHTLPSAYEKHVSIRSGNQTTYALSKSKGNAVKDQHRNDNQPAPRLFRQSTWKSAFCFRSPQGKLSPLLQPRVAEAKSLLSRNRHTGRDAYQSQQGMMINEARKNEPSKN